MELTLDGNSEIGAHLVGEIGNFIRIRHFLQSVEVKIQIYLEQKTVFLHTCALFSELSSNIRTGSDRIRIFFTRVDPVIG